MNELNETLKVIKTSKDNENISMCVSAVLTDLRGKTLFILERFSLLYYFPYYSCVCTSIACTVIVGRLLYIPVRPIFSNTCLSLSKHVLC